MRLSLRLTPLLLLCSLSPAHAWHVAGHELIVRIAWKNLTPAAQGRIEALLKAHPDVSARTLDGASVYPDRLRGDRSARDEDRHPEWHYINKPFVVEGIPTTVPGASNVVTAIPKCIAVVKNRSASDSEKAVALSWILHLVGDIHQPLHCLTRYTAAQPTGDRGGNGYRILVGDRSVSLHSFWDSLPGGDAETVDLEKLQASILADFPRKLLKECSERSPARWAEEGFALRNFVYSAPEDQAPPESYRAEAIKIARRRVALAGYRLADLLNRLF